MCKETSNGVVCDGKDISLYEMRKKQQKHEDARIRSRTTVVA